MKTMRAFAEFKRFAREQKDVVRAMATDKDGRPEHQALKQLVLTSPVFLVALSALLAAVCAMTFEESLDEVEKKWGPK